MRCPFLRYPKRFYPGPWVWCQFRHSTPLEAKTLVSYVTPNAGCISPRAWARLSNSFGEGMRLTGACHVNVIFSGIQMTRSYNIIDRPRSLSEPPGISHFFSVARRPIMMLRSHAQVLSTTNSDSSCAAEPERAHSSRLQSCFRMSPQPLISSMHR